MPVFIPPFFARKKGGAKEACPSIAGEAGSPAKDLLVSQNELCYGKRRSPDLGLVLVPDTAEPLRPVVLPEGGSGQGMSIDTEWQNQLRAPGRVRRLFPN